MPVNVLVWRWLTLRDMKNPGWQSAVCFQKFTKVDVLSWFEWTDGISAWLTSLAVTVLKQLQQVKLSQNCKPTWSWIPVAKLTSCSSEIWFSFTKIQFLNSDQWSVSVHTQLICLLVYFLVWGDFEVSKKDHMMLCWFPFSVSSPCIMYVIYSVPSCSRQTDQRQADVTSSAPSAVILHVWPHLIFTTVYIDTYRRT